MANNTILVVDDELGIRELLSEILGDEGYTVMLAENAEEARACRNQLRPDLVLLDIWMPDTDGITLLKEWANNGSLTMPVVIMSGHGTIETAVEATRIGAVGYLEKPIPLQKLLSTVGQVLRGAQHPSFSTFSLTNLGRSNLIMELRRKLEQVQNLKIPVLLTGEPGVGFEYCARFLHRINTTWVEPELPALLAERPLEPLEKARGGLIFLGEIGDLNKLEQKGLLLILGKLEHYNVRLVCATARPLAELTAQGLFHPKLFEILSSLTISIPPLRLHREDIPEIANQLLSALIESGEVPVLQFNTAALNALRNYDWPGNLAQLTSIVHSLAVTCTQNEISADTVQQALAFSPQETGVVSDIPLNITLREARDIFEKTYFEKLIEQEGGNMTRVAERAGLERTHLYRKIKTLGIKTRSQLQ
ncbi:sigma-54-dependent transcriptional regulator [Nitrosomonas mobilis]|uniref:Two component, sigma54 specific, transcriptional regulator, Fis family protein n=1 Tax=Nitrosomonas mobilis TaxID=51642 RepID=A0A1G5SGL6_9PROT|nr:sigma-54 dependent transcriptional regulator [Nitrosomonas mobilis]SCZ86268.1 Two component, sigma54 specific, transcriptional regulator, Fis family protein [Nitrosomonas mobilis]